MIKMIGIYKKNECDQKTAQKIMKATLTDSLMPLIHCY